jgi:hypothetical protein
VVDVNGGVEAGMAATEATVRGYEELAEAHDRKRETRQRDWFLVLAADAALSLGQHDRAERLRRRLLALNPHHLLKPFPSMAEALRSPDIQRFVEDLRRQHPLPTSPPAKDEPAPPEPLKVVWRKQPPPAPKLAPPLSPPPLSPPPPQLAPAPPSLDTNGLARVESPYGQSASASSTPRRPASDDPAEGGWIAVAVFVVCLLGFLALAGYSLVRPVIQGW